MPHASEAAHLGVPVELVTAEVEQDDRPRLDRSRDLRQERLVHLQHTDAAGAVGGERRLTASL